MARRCQRCKMLEKHKYWNELPSTKKHRFLKDMSCGYFQHQLELWQLSIPDKFVKYFKGESLSGWWSLRGPTGKQWMVQIRRIEDETVFSEGWGSFVKDHNINPGETLIFTYTGLSSFQVSIFKSSGCEREVAHFATHSGSGSGSNICSTFLDPHHKMNINHNNQSDDDQETRSSDDDDDDDPVEIIRYNEHQTPRSEDRQGPSSGARTRRRTRRARDNEHQTPGSSSLLSSKMFSSESDDDEEMSKWSEWRPSDDDDDDDASVEITGTKRTPRVEHQTPRSEEKEPPSGRRAQGPSSQGKRCKTVYISNRRPMTHGEKQRALGLARSFTLKSKHSGIPTFQIIMLHSHVYHTFHATIPWEWAQEHMVAEYDKVELRVPGVEGTWVVRCRWSNLRNEYELTRQWKIFVLDNNLEEHDVCVFQLVKKGRKGSMRRAIFNVHIFRVAEEAVPLTIFRR